MAGENEIFVVTGPGQGHLHPSMELCNHLASRSYHSTLVVPSTALSSFIPSSFTQNPLTGIVRIAGSSTPHMPGPDPFRHQAAQDLEAQLSGRSARPLCAIIDFQMGWTKNIFWKFDVPVIGFFTFGACAAAMEWGAWKAEAGDIKPGELRLVPGLPEEMALNYSDLKRRYPGPPGGPPGAGSNPPIGGGGGGGPPKPGDRPPWVPEIEGSIGLMFNTCDDLERPFIDYLTNQIAVPVWGVGPLLPEQYWKSSDSLIHDHQIREHRRQSNYSEDDVVQWLNSKPRGSVLYVSFGSEVGPTMEEYPHLANALVESARPFIWVIQPGSGIPIHVGVGDSGRADPGDPKEGYFSHGLELDSKVGERGLIIEGWAPQLLILSHPSTGGFLSHCGWNSTVEAMGRGVPFLAWPIRGDQYYNAKLVVSYLEVGHRVAENLSEMVRKEDVAKGIETLMGDDETKKRAMTLRLKFNHGFPMSSVGALDDFCNFIRRKGP
ncbi:UDP-glucuronosyl/UDP-glucosyltransferase [Trema orientale]|uniref:UDP-glucuronosyl/UDP-glucosyltransferase n=1 Tax=Trema orientale TaxID=63057 RepID=A0A2P5FA89_TREOI|nr:UDP-glucuronosyl/UDP-glucosyltransferase [Trema orientale]